MVSSNPRHSTHAIPSAASDHCTLTSCLRVHVRPPRPLHVPSSVPSRDHASSPSTTTTRASSPAVVICATCNASRPSSKLASRSPTSFRCTPIFFLPANTSTSQPMVSGTIDTRPIFLSATGSVDATMIGTATAAS